MLRSLSAAHWIRPQEYSFARGLTRPSCIGALSNRLPLCCRSASCSHSFGALGHDGRKDMAGPVPSLGD